MSLDTSPFCLGRPISWHVTAHRVLLLFFFFLYFCSIHSDDSFSFLIFFTWFLSLIFLVRLDGIVSMLSTLSKNQLLV